jgi:hypothetical protein
MIGTALNTIRPAVGMAEVKIKSHYHNGNGTSSCFKGKVHYMLNVFSTQQTA